MHNIDINNTSVEEQIINQEFDSYEQAKTMAELLDIESFRVKQLANKKYYVVIYPKLMDDSNHNIVKSEYIYSKYFGKFKIVDIEKSKKYKPLDIGTMYEIKIKKFGVPFTVRASKEVKMCCWRTQRYTFDEVFDLNTHSGRVSTVIKCIIVLWVSITQIIRAIIEYYGTLK